MPRSDRPPSFQFYPADHLADPAVNAMSCDQQGRYVRALCFSWDTSTPGQATEITWRGWFGYNETEWLAHREVMAGAFRIEPDGSWTQKRMVDERAKQILRHAQASRGAQATNSKRWASDAQRPLQRSHSDAPSARSPVALSSSASASPSNKDKTGDKSRKGRPPFGPHPVTEVAPPEPEEVDRAARKCFKDVDQLISRADTSGIDEPVTPNSAEAETEGEGG